MVLETACFLANSVKGNIEYQWDQLPSSKHAAFYWSFDRRCKIDTLLPFRLHQGGALPSTPTHTG